MTGQGLRLFNAKAIAQLLDPELSLTIQVAPAIATCWGWGPAKTLPLKT